MWGSYDLEENESQRITGAAEIKSVVVSRNLWDVQEEGSRAIQQLSNLDAGVHRPSVPNTTSVPLYSFAFKDSLSGVDSQMLGHNFILNFKLEEAMSFALVTLFFVLRYLVVPYVLFVFSCYLWEAYFVSLRDKSSNLPLPNGRMGLPIVGEMFNFILRGVNFQRCRRREFGPVYRTHLFGSPTIMVTGEKYVKRLLLGEGQLVETQWPYTTRVIIGTDGIVNGSKETHTRIKRLALRAFSPRFMETYAKSVQRSIHTHVQDWMRKGELHILEECRQLVAKTMLTVLMGIQEDDPDIQKYIKAADDIINSILCIPFEVPYSALRKGKQARQFIFDHMETQLKAKMQSSDEDLFDEPGFDASTVIGSGVNIDEIAAGGRRQDSVLINIIKLARLEGETNIKLQNLQNLSLEFIFAGTQSLQSSSSLMMMHLSQHPEVVERLRQEIKENNLWSVPLEEIPYKRINSLKYINHVVNEVLRVTPPIPGAIRVAKKTFELSGYQVPKRWQVVYSIRETHELAAGEKQTTRSHIDFNPSYFDCKECQTKKTKCMSSSQDQFPNQGRDKGDEILEHNSTHKCHNMNGSFSFIPFGKGARMCAGKNYALFVLRVLLLEVVRSTKFGLTSAAKIIEIPMTKPARSVKIHFRSMSE